MKHGLPLLLCSLLLICLSCQEEAPLLPEPDYATDAASQNVLSKTLDLPSTPYQYSLLIEGTSTQPPIEQHIDPNKALLGRVLFYDKNLSADRSVSCASCHQQALAFADDKAFSDGVYGNKTARNSLGLSPLASVAKHYSSELIVDRNAFRLFWDERTQDPEAQIMQTMMNELEMDMNPYELPEKLAELDYYRVLWQRISGEPYSPYGSWMTARDITSALSSFISSIQAADSKFDQGFEQANRLVNQPFSNFTPSENMGKNLFVANCASCHGFSLGADVGIQLTGQKTVANNGLDFEYTDKGVGGPEAQNHPHWNGVFKIPGLRNIEVTGPYMHDGRFNTLEEVVEHYRTGVKAHPNLDPLLMNAETRTPVRLNITDEEAIALVDFLKTLTDQNTLTDPKWSDPFK